MKPTNPKAAHGAQKVNLFLLPPVAIYHWGHAQMIGEIKYGTYKWRETRVEASVYIAAAVRHIQAWASGEERDPIDLTHHLGNAMACMGILLDAQAHGNLVDNRAKDGGVLTGVIEEIMTALRERLEIENGKKTRETLGSGLDRPDSSRVDPFVADHPSQGEEAAPSLFNLPGFKA